MEIYLTRTLRLQINGKRKESILHWSNCRGAINSRFYKNDDKCGRLGLNPSAKKGSVHFLLGAMLPCSTPFSTSAISSITHEISISKHEEDYLITFVWYQYDVWQKRKKYNSSLKCEREEDLMSQYFCLLVPILIYTSPEV